MSEWTSGDAFVGGWPQAIRATMRQTGSLPRDGGWPQAIRATMQQTESLPRVAATRIHYCRTGGSKPPLVLLHGITDNGRCWSRVAEALAPDYDVVMPDARGHGLSAAPESGYTAEDHAPDVAGVISELGLQHAVVIGHSMGGATAAATAAHFPALVRALVLEDPPWGGPPEALSDEQKAARVSDWRAGIMKRKTQSLADIVAYGRRRYPAWHERDLAAWAEAKQQTSPNIAAGINGQGIAWQDVVRQIRCPSWVITADPALGAIVTAERIQEAMRLCPALKEAHVAGAGHNIHRDQFESFISAVKGCLRELG